MQKTGLIVVIAVVSILTGCSTTVSQYTPRIEPEPILRTATAKRNFKLTINDASRQTSIQCRGYGPIIAPSGQSFGSYVVAAENLELQSANAFDPATSNTIEVNFDRIDFSTGLGNAVWYIDATYRVAGKSLPISTIYKDENGSSFMADRACQNIASYFRSAVSEHTRQLFQHPIFREVIGARTQSISAPPIDQSIQSRLNQLESLRKTGLVTQAEYEEQRKRILGGL